VLESISFLVGGQISPVLDLELARKRRSLSYERKHV